jgi:putative tricarboxylic transport membrane protein
MFNNDQVSSTLWFCIGLLGAGFSIPYGIGDVHSPGTGFLPFYTSLTICLLAGGVFIEGTLSSKKGEKWKNPFAKVQWTKPVIALAALLSYTLILDTVGFIAATALLVGFLLRVIQPQKWLVVVLGAILTSIITYLVFQLWLGTQLPAGIFSALGG